MVPHAFQRFPASLERLAERLGLLQFGGVDFRGLIVAGQFAQLLGSVVLPAFHPLGDDMEAVGKAPGEIGGERLHPGVPQHVEQGRHHHFDRSANLVRVGHVEALGFVDDAELGHLAIFDESTVIALDLVVCVACVGNVTGEIGEVGEIGHESLLGCDLILVMRPSSGHAVVGAVRDGARQAPPRSGEWGNRFSAVGAAGRGG